MQKKQPSNQEQLRKTALQKILTTIRAAHTYQAVTQITSDLPRIYQELVELSIPLLDSLSKLFDMF